MKKVLLLMAGILMIFNTVSAEESNLDRGESSRYGYQRPIKFMERGITFYVFQNGEFDFNAHTYRNRRRAGVNTNYGLNNNNSDFRDRPVRIEYGYNGRIRRVGNAFVNYDSRGRVKRIGSVYMRYRHNRLVRVGNKRLIYNRYGRLIRTVGRVKPRGTRPGYGNVNDYDFDDGWNDDGIYDNDDWGWNDNDQDDGGVLYLRGKEDEKKKKR